MASSTSSTRLDVFPGEVVGLCELAQKVRDNRLRPDGAPVTEVLLHDRRAFLHALPGRVQVRHREPLVNRQVHDCPVDPMLARDGERLLGRPRASSVTAADLVQPRVGLADAGEVDGPLAFQGGGKRQRFFRRPDAAEPGRRATTGPGPRKLSPARPGSCGTWMWGGRSLTLSCSARLCSRLLRPAVQIALEVLGVASGTRAR